LDHWRSRKTGADYPSLVRLEATNPATAKPEVFLVQSFVANQELAGKTGGVSYWEGACRVLDERQHAIGQAYMELTGYSENLKGKF
jgi:predicted secreted hydrolase